MQELWAIGLAYNLIRLENGAGRGRSQGGASRISFVMSMRLIRDEWMWAAASKSPGAIPGNFAACATNSSGLSCRRAGQLARSRELGF